MIKLDMCLEELLPTVTNKAVIFLASAVSGMGGGGRGRCVSPDKAVTSTRHLQPVNTTGTNARSIAPLDGSQPRVARLCIPADKM